MKASNTRILGLLALGLAVTASSQAGVQAQFHLPVAAHWGQALLAPGDYKLLISDAASGFSRVVIQGEGGTVCAMPLVADPKASNGSASLLLVKREGNYFVREYRSEVDGKTCTFGIPKRLAPGKPISIELKN